MSSRASTEDRSSDMLTELRKAIIHDIVHKPIGKSHKHGGVKLITTADGDAARMSRPIIKKKVVWGDDVSSYRTSLVTGTSFYDATNFKKATFWSELERDFINSRDDVETLYQRLLDSDVVSRFNEFGLLPHTSLKYHSILVTNLTWNYLRGKKFSDLYLHIIDEESEDRLFAKIMVLGDGTCLTISEQNHDARAWSHIGARLSYDGKNKSMMNFGDVLCRMRGLVDVDKILWSNLQRLPSWSVGLQYWEDVVHEV